MTSFGRPSWLDRAVDEALAVCPTMQPWEVRVMLIAAAPTIQNAATEAVAGRLSALIVEIEDDPDQHPTRCARFYDGSDDCTCDVGPVTDLLRDRAAGVVGGV